MHTNQDTVDRFVGLCARIGEANRVLLRLTAPDDRDPATLARRAEAAQAIEEGEALALSLIHGGMHEAGSCVGGAIGAGSLALVREMAARQTAFDRGVGLFMWAAPESWSDLLSNADADRVHEIVAVPILGMGITNALATSFAIEPDASEVSCGDIASLIDLVPTDEGASQIYGILKASMRTARPAETARLLRVLVSSVPETASRVVREIGERRHVTGMAMLLLAGADATEASDALPAGDPRDLLALWGSNHGRMVLHGRIGGLEAVLERMSKDEPVLEAEIRDLWRAQVGAAL